MSKPNGFVVYEGASRLTRGVPVVAILVFTSSNNKTGPMAQLYIMPKDEHPNEAALSGADESACGDCAGRPSKDGWCYVLLAFGPGMVHKSYKAGKYPKLDLRLADHRRWLQDLIIRYGAWGDPAALPPRVIARLRSAAGADQPHTSYTHQFDKFPDAAEYSMVSVDNREQFDAVHANHNVRTYRILREGEELADNEIECLYYTKGIQCIDCRLCDGNAHSRRPSIAVPVHGAKSKRLN